MRSFNWLVLIVTLYCVEEVISSRASGQYAPFANSTGNSTGCVVNKDCGSCSSSFNCIWCDTTSNCTDGAIYGNSACSKYYWKQCKADGKLVFISTLGAVALILLLVVICICKCICCQKKKQRKRVSEFEFTAVNPEDTDDPKTPLTNKRREEMKEKWGIGT